MTTSLDTLFIGGEWVPPSSAGRIEVRNASTGEVIGSVPEAAEADVDAAVAAARRAFDDPSGWSAWTPTGRLRRAAGHSAGPVLVPVLRARTVRGAAGGER